MPRKGHVAKREVLPDPLYNSTLVTKLVNSIMLDGKKGVAEKIVYGAFKRVEEKTGRNPLEVFEEALNNIMPVLEVKARRVPWTSDLTEDAHSASDGLLSTAENAEKKQWKNVSLEKSLTLLTTQAELARKKKKHTKWQRQTKLSPITNGNITQCRFGGR